MTDRFATGVLRQIQKAAGHPNLLFYLDELDIHIVYMAIVGLPYPYMGGEFFFKLTLPSDFPRKPPELRCLTENGVYMVGGKICISIGEFHATDRAPPSGAAGHQGDWGWSPASGLRGFSVEVLNGLITPEILNEVKHPDSGQGGLGILDTPAETRATAASLSAEYNDFNNKKLRMDFLDHVKHNPSDAGAAWMKQIAQARVCSARKLGQLISRDDLKRILDAGLVDKCDDGQLPLAAAVCVLETSYQEGALDCLLATEATIGEVVSKYFAFLAEAVKNTSLPVTVLKGQIIKALVANMRQNFTERDQILAAIRSSSK